MKLLQLLTHALTKEMFKDVIHTVRSVVGYPLTSILFGLDTNIPSSTSPGSTSTSAIFNWWCLFHGTERNGTQGYFTERNGTSVNTEVRYVVLCISLSVKFLKPLKLQTQILCLIFPAAVRAHYTTAAQPDSSYLPSFTVATSQR